MNRRDYQNDFDEMIDHFGWAAHYVPLEDAINYHTHGVQETFGHLDFQIVLPVGMGSAHAIANSLIDSLAQGRGFQEDKLYDGFLGNGYLLKFKRFTECGRPVLRVILPDVNGLFPGDVGCDEKYLMQLRTDID